MGIWDRLFGKRQPQALTPDELRDQLFDAVDDEARFTSLCREHEALILRTFADWKRVPEGLRQDRDAVNRWGRGLITVAQFFAQQGNDELMQLLRGPAGANPLEIWEGRLAEASGYINERKFAEAIVVFTACLDQGKGLSGPGKDHYLALTHGGLGHSLFHNGAVQEAEAHVVEALRLCQESGAEDDREGVPIYLKRLYEVRRYLGDAAGAAQLAERLSNAVHLDAERKKWRRQAEILRCGEPLNRVVVQVGEESYELDELPHVDGAVKFEFVRNRDGLLAAEELIDQGSQYGSGGAYEQALACFQEAAKIDPHHPQPHYMGALTMIHLRRYREAVASYEKVESLAPGWFHCRADLAVARALTEGRLDHETFRALEELEGTSNPDSRLKLASDALSRAPDLAVLHLHKGRALLELKQTDDAKASYERGLAGADDEDVKTRLLVELAGCTRDPLRRTQLLEEAISASGNLVAAAMAKVMLRAAPEA